MEFFKWIRSKPYGKGAIIGFFLGIFWIVSAYVGSNVCGWSIIQGPAERSFQVGLCGNNFIQLIFFGPFIIAFAIFLLISLTPIIGPLLSSRFVFDLFIPLILIIITTLLGALIGRIFVMIRKNIKK